MVTTRNKVVRPCGNKIKLNGRCLVHKNKCVTGTRPRRAVQVSPEGAPIEPVARVEVEEIKQVEKCPCIVTTKKGLKKVCGNKAKENGKCGIHQKKCNLPEELPEAKVEDDFEDVVGDLLEEIPILPSPVPEATGVSEWNTISAASEEEALRYLETVKDRPEYNISRYEEVDALIAECLTL
jgi:hypothetical protein